MPMTIRHAEACLAPLRYIKFRRRDGEWRITMRGLTCEREEAVAYYTDDPQDAVDTARLMNAERRLELEEGVS